MDSQVFKGQFVPQIVSKKLEFGHGLGAGMHIQALVDGEEVLNREGHSLIQGFIMLLAMRMRGAANGLGYSESSAGDWASGSNTTEENDLSLGYEYYSSFSLPAVNYSGSYITSCSNASPARIGLDSASDTWATIPTGVKVCEIAGVTGTTSINGRKYLSYDTNVGGIYYFFVYDDIGLTTPTDTTGDGAFGGTGQVRFLNRVRMEYDNIGSSNQLLIGRSNQAVAITDDVLINEINDGDNTGELNRQGSASVSTEAINQSLGTGEIQLTEDFVNNSGGSVDVNEIGWACFAGSTTDGTTKLDFNTNEYFLLARDVVTTISVPDGSTLTLNYTFKTTLVTDDGGWLQQFHQLLYRVLTRAVRASVDYRNIDADDDYSLETLFVPGGAGGAMYTTTYEYPMNGGEFTGIVPGTSTNSVNIADYFVQTHIPHGWGNGHLVYGGTMQRRINISGSTASFKLVRMFYNAGATGITVNEICLVTAGDYWLTDSIYRNLHTIVRHSLSDAAEEITVAAGQGLILEYEISVTVS